MKTGDFAPYGKFNPNTGPSAGGMQPQQEEGGGMGGMAGGDQQGGMGGMQQPPDMNPTTPNMPDWINYVPPGLMQVFERAPQVGMGAAFMERYGKQFASMNEPQDFEGMSSKADEALGFGGMGTTVGTLDTIEDDGTLHPTDPDFDMFELGALIQSMDHVIGGGLGYEE